MQTAASLQTAAYSSGVAGRTTLRAPGSSRSAFFPASPAMRSAAGFPRSRGQQRQLAVAALQRRKKAAKTTKKASSKDVDVNNKGQVLDKVLEDIEATFGAGSVMRLGDEALHNVEMFSSGALTLDLALGGGYPKGRIVEIYGPESAGKTTLALLAMASVQREGGTCVFIDAEHAFDPEYAAVLGVKCNDLLVCQPESGEMALQVVDKMVRSQAVDMICIDSVAALVPRAEIEGEIGDQLVGVQARLMSQALRKLATNASKAKCTIIFLNQIRMKIGVIYGSPEVTSGGNALKFYASQRVDIRRKETIKGATGADEDVGIRARITVKKNKVAPPFRKAEIDIMFKGGVSRAGAVLDAAESMGIVDRKGSWYGYGETRLGQGRGKAVISLEEDPSLMSEIEAKVREEAFGVGAVVAFGEDGPLDGEGEGGEEEEDEEAPLDFGDKGAGPEGALAREGGAEEEAADA